MEEKRIGKQIGFLFWVVLMCLCTANYVTAATDDSTEILSSAIYEIAEDDAYDISKGHVSTEMIERFTVSGPIDNVDQKDGVPSYAVNVEEDEKLDIRIKDLTDCVEGYTKDGWGNDGDNSRKLDTISLDGRIKSGAIVIQTSRDGEIWTTAESYVDVFDEGLSELLENDEPLYSTTNVELNNGCYYRILVAYKLKKQVEDSKILVVNVKNYEYQKMMEAYEFYAYNENVELSDTLNINEAYKLGDLVRCEQSKGYYGSKPIKSDDPHNNWEIGDFYISGYTAYKEDSSDKTPVFLKEVGDRVTLWFNLGQDLDKCNGKSSITVVADPEGQDQEFRSPTMDFGKGMLIVRKTDELNKTTTQYYKNYLEASASAGANTRIDLFEEGDYEVALDYALKYERAEVFNREILPQTIHYRVSFQFSVRNGDCKLFVRDAVTDEFIDNANIAENGFYLDLAKQKYLDLSIKREVMTDSLDGLVADTKFNAAGKEGRIYTEEGVYTITATNKYTSATTEKKIYVGDSDILKAYMTTGLSVAQINEMLSQGAYIDENWNVVEPTFKG